MTERYFDAWFIQGEQGKLPPIKIFKGRIQEDVVKSIDAAGGLQNISEIIPIESYGEFEGKRMIRISDIWIEVVRPREKVI